MEKKHFDSKVKTYYVTIKNKKSLYELMIEILNMDTCRVNVKRGLIVKIVAVFALGIKREVTIM